MVFLIQADGGARGNPGPAGSGAAVWNEAKEQILSVSDFLGHTTNNVAEYTAIVRALEKLQAHLGAASRDAVVHIEMDSKLVVEQMSGRWKVKHPNMKPLAARALALGDAFKQVSYAHIPREKNGTADALANAAMDRGQ